MESFLFTTDFVCFFYNRPLHSPERTVSSSSSIPDVPAIYFALPNDENVDRICRDVQSNLYGTFFLNFIRPIPRSKIEEVASAVLNSGDTKCVNKVYDQYVDFVCLEDEFFVLNSGNKSSEEFYGEHLCIKHNLLFSCISIVLHIPVILFI